jgi:hypothetical protein
LDVGDGQIVHFAFEIAGAASVIPLALAIGCKKYLIPRPRENARKGQETGRTG